ncbi:beta-galactosidase [Aspergillus avenaceus]|uniref:Beta-galactosidase n=1 Tax=Aspergillus avenaceus TaxID=36643 RepID=A0A5N6U4C9_ASPAV|nr:beta-galactosidase [Aspergillus avenaceus]
MSSMFKNFTRILLLTGEFHPFRLPSPGLWIDVFQKVRAIGYSAAASEAGIYLIARPGPYINSEVSGGGFPGWLGRLSGRLKTTDQDYLDAITPYISTIGNIIAKVQITNGGPVILFQPENEYTLCANATGYTQVNNMTITEIDTSCLQKEYMAYIEARYREAGITVPFLVNDASSVGNFAPGTGVGAVDIYSFDHYPLGWAPDPHGPSNWSSLLDPLRFYNFSLHEMQSPRSPFAISKFQGGVPDPWGGVGVETSAAYINSEFARVFYKLNYGFRIAIQSLYMLFGGTNWGNLGHPSGYTSYDVGAAIAKNRMVHREKYSELKLQANFLQVTPSYLISQPHNATFGVYTDSHDLVVTRLEGSPTDLYIVRHHDVTSMDSISYHLSVSSSIGNLTIPTLGGSLQLNGRDSKFHVVDYDVGGINLIYSTAEIFTWKKSHSRTVLVLNGGEGELHEFALPAELGNPSSIEDDGVELQSTESATVIQWQVASARRVVVFGDTLEVHLLWRNEAYNYWVLDLPASQPLGLHISPSRAEGSVVVRAGYLMRTAHITGNTLHLTGDINATTDIEVISVPTRVASLEFNGKGIATSMKAGRVVGQLTYEAPSIVLSTLADLEWRYIDSLPELGISYSDSEWTPCNHTRTNNPRNLSTPTSLYASDYGYHSGSLLYRGAFIADGSESSLWLLTEGGFAYGHSVWLNSTYLGSWDGIPADMFYNHTLSFPEKLEAGVQYVITILVDHMGLDLNFPANIQIMKDPRGILDYSIGRGKTVVSWKVTGNIGGEAYQDISRGPLNEGALYAERQGSHLPGAPNEDWKQLSPIDGLQEPGVGFFVTSFALNIPSGYDVPLSVFFTNTSLGDSDTPAKFRCQLFINGWEFGKYVNHIGPQTRYPVPEGILNYNGTNTVALSLWSHESKPVGLADLKLEADAVLQSGYTKPALVDGARYSKRANAY